MFLVRLSSSPMSSHQEATVMPPRTRPFVRIVLDLLILLVTAAQAGASPLRSYRLEIQSRGGKGPGTTTSGRGFPWAVVLNGRGSSTADGNDDQAAPVQSPLARGQPGSTATTAPIVAARDDNPPASDPSARAGGAYVGGLDAVPAGLVDKASSVNTMTRELADQRVNVSASGGSDASSVNHPIAASRLAGRNTSAPDPTNTTNPGISPPPTRSAITSGSGATAPVVQAKSSTDPNSASPATSESSQATTGSGPTASPKAAQPPGTVTPAASAAGTPAGSTPAASTAISSAGSVPSLAVTPADGSTATQMLTAPASPASGSSPTGSTSSSPSSTAAPGTAGASALGSTSPILTNPLGVVAAGLLSDPAIKPVT